MHRNFIVAALSLLAAGTTLAQDVTVYGRLNVSVERLDRDGVKSTDMVNSSSRIGFKGSEDLGGGLKAGFQLEHGFSPTNGTQSQSAFWARQSEVYLAGNFGTVRLGNFTSEAYYATADYISMHNHDTGTSADALYAYLGRDTSKIAYRSPDLGGFSLEAGTSLKETNPDSTYDVAVNYAAGDLALGAGYQKDGDANQFALRALYAMGPFVVGGYVQRDEDAYGPGKRTTLRASGMYTVGASEFHLNVGRAGDYSDLDDSSATQFTLGYNYNLSKRTKAYAFYTKLNASDATPYASDLSSFALGMRHNF